MKIQAKKINNVIQNVEVQNLYNDLLKEIIEGREIHGADNGYLHGERGRIELLRTPSKMMTITHKEYFFDDQAEELLDRGEIVTIEVTEI